MDTSETYIRMCKKAEEIQPYMGDNDGVSGTWIGNSILYHLAPMNQPHDRDGYYHITDEETIRRCESCGHEEPYISRTTAIWLPRQDQLQEMLEDIEKFDTSIMSITILVNFARFCGIDDQDEEGRSNIYLRKESLEVLWLAFVMKEKYNKVWNGEGWVED